MIEPRKEFMLEAIRQAKIAQSENDYAIGAVIVQNNKILVACSSRSKRDESPIAHAETLAIIEASKIMKSRHLPDCIIYTTHEPCPMCTSVAIFAKLKGIICGARIEDMRDYRLANGDSSYLWRTIDIDSQEIINKSTEKVEFIKDFMRDECKQLFHS